MVVNPLQLMETRAVGYQPPREQSLQLVKLLFNDTKRFARFQKWKEHSYGSYRAAEMLEEIASKKHRKSFDFAEVMFRNKAYREAYRMLEEMAANNRAVNAAMFGCENPAVRFEIAGMSKYSNLPLCNVNTAKFLGDEWFVDRCGDCARCIWLNTALWGDRARAEFAVATRVSWQLTLTCANPEPSIQLLNYELVKFKKKLRQRYVRAGIVPTMDSCMEYGTKNTRRKHAHLNLYNVGEILVDGHRETFPSFPNGFVIREGSDWPLGNVGIQPIMDAQGAAYNGKYCQKAAALFLPTSKSIEERHFIENVKGDPIILRYFQSARSPALGDNAVKAMIQMQSDELVDKFLSDQQTELRLDVSPGPGLVVESRPLMLGRRHKEMVAQHISSRLGRTVETHEAFKSEVAVKRQALRNLVIGPELDRFRFDPLLDVEIDYGDPAGLAGIDDGELVA